MKRFILLSLTTLCLLTICSSVNAGRRDVNKEIEAVMADANQKINQGDNNVFLPDQNIEWRNGVFDCQVVTCYDKNDNPSHVAFSLDERGEYENGKHYYEVAVKKGKPCVVKPNGVTVNHEVAGQWDMLVFRNASGAVLDVALKKNPGTDDEAAADMRDMLNGVYAGTGDNASDTVVFGAVYGDDGSRLPGADYRLEYMDYNGDRPKLSDHLQVAYVPERMKRVYMPSPSKKEDENGVTHYYADDKEVTRNEYEFLMSRPSGYGGHGSLHGPLWWIVKPQGDDLAVELTQPFAEELDAFYSNFRNEKFSLKWVRSPYKDKKDRWAVLSMRPVTRGMLAYFDKATLQHMLNYLNACKTPTDIEQLNKSLINTIVNGAATTKKTTNTQKKKRKTRKR